MTFILSGETLRKDFSLHQLLMLFGVLTGQLKNHAQSEMCNMQSTWM